MSDRQPSHSSEPLVWLLMGNRAGDNSQVLGLGEALGWPLVEKHFEYTRYEKLVNLPFGAHLLGVVRERSSAIEPPWPDLVISAGRKNEPIARYVRKRADKRVRLIHVGRPWARPETWDLVVTTPQYRLPDVPNVLHNDTPLHRVTRARLDVAAERWRERLIADDEAMTQWMAEYPDCDTQRLRSLVRAARRDSAALTPEQRQPKSFRELFQFIRPLLPESPPT